jgi:outer membrane protein OmpA-like peptidoglycan-associated protein
MLNWRRHSSTDAGGDATDLLTAGTTAGPVTVTATVDGTALSVTATNLTVIPGPPTSIIVSGGDNQSQTPTAAFTEALTVNVTDNWGNAVEPTQIDWAVTGGSAQLSSGSSTTDSSGDASIDLTAGTTAGPVTVTATVHGLGLVATFDETVIPGPPANIAIQSGNSQSTSPIAAFGSPLVVNVTDNWGNDVSPTLVDWNVTSGFAQLSADSSGTDGSGDASIDLTAGTVAEPLTVSATVDGTSISTNFSELVNPGPPATITVLSGNGQSQTPTLGFGADLVVNVTDNWGNPVAPTQIDWSVESGSANLSVANSMTDSSGDAVVGLTAGTVAGPVSITAIVDSTILTTDFSETVIPGAPSSLSELTGDSQSALSNTNFGAALSTELTDAWGNDITGADVTYHVVSGSATFGGSASTTVTTVNGDTSVTLHAGRHAGTEDVVAKVNGTNVTASFSGITIYPPTYSRTVSGFVSGSPVLSASNLAYVESIAQTINGYGNTTVTITGFADVTGSQPENKSVSLARAKAVKAALLADLHTLGDHGVLITAKGGGVKLLPGLPSNSPRDRRAELQIS